MTQLCGRHAVALDGTLPIEHSTIEYRFSVMMQIFPPPFFAFHRRRDVRRQQQLAAAAAYSNPSFSLTSPPLPRFSCAIASSRSRILSGAARVFLISCTLASAHHVPRGGRRPSWCQLAAVPQTCPIRRTSPVAKTASSFTTTRSNPINRTHQPSSPFTFPHHLTTSAA